MKPLFALAIAATMVSGCVTSDDFTSSRFATPTASGTFNTSTETRSRGSEIDIAGNGFAYQVGLVPDGEGFRAEAGIIPGTDVGAPTTVNATYTGVYEVRAIRDIELNGNLLSGTTDGDSGSISLEADFTAGTLTGGGAILSVDGTISGQDIGGSVTYRGDRGALDGLIGDERAVGVFHGNDSDDVFAGGFLVTPE